MENKIIMVIDIPFNVPENPFWPGFKDVYNDSKKLSQTKEWIEYRIEIFNKYTLRSLKNQTNQNFKCIMRYTKETEEIVFNSLSKYDKLPDNVIFTSDGDETIYSLIQGYDYIYHIRIDSDNMFSKDYIDILYKTPYYEELECILCKNGYMYEIEGDRLASMEHGSPSFYALVYTVDDFYFGFRHNTEPDHWGAANLTHKVIDTHSYLVIVHEKNVSNSFNMVLNYPHIKTVEIFKEEKEEILKSFDLK
ncbi:rhamnosyl transferase family protein [[Clostridium] bifermentans ATCC 638]|uniref:Rhamnosyl transferase family protein n=1 Tax=Paraclostridium bifermentans ATCC 638 = DSM 14991 TaxID=1233171 RepID=T4VR64_PARBF|nr:glycosyltransferase family A protein [Paraclostridium bifermentans]EQK43167.1 rhamnosyl transferase family protein [[Clostridium] bifermentans ATCC 638] [Paraclostridium bifermentans ATCC 638 = DSM 14991]RIZ60393.1 glycosyltransferase family 2 protein [Paraclostridium bifermentans]UAG17035.1 glycosyltransferase family 2 protein [Paraclostridium bifermentans]